MLLSIFRRSFASSSTTSTRHQHQIQLTSLAVEKSYKNILYSTKDKVALIALNRQDALNALSSELMNELKDAFDAINRSADINVVVLTGSEKSFAAGADIQEMSSLSFSACYKDDFLASWRTLFSSMKKPVIAAVNGYALGGGCELAMMCDIVYAGERAKFAQPEIKLGTIPGGGGTQRLTRAVGKSKAMEMILTGKHIDAFEAERIGLISKVFAPDKVLDEALNLASEIANYSQPVIMMCKEAVQKAFEMSLEEGLDYERRLFHSSFALNDRAEGMKAFLEKRKPNFQNN